MSVLRCLAIGTFVVPLGCRREPPAAMSQAQVKAATSLALEAHAQAALRRDVDAAVSLFTPDAVVMFPGTPDIRGADSVAALMRRSWPAINPTAVRYETDEAYVAGSWAITIARYWVTLTPNGQPQVQDSGRYMFLWRHDTSGTWRVQRAIPNSLVPPTGE